LIFTVLTPTQRIELDSLLAGHLNAANYGWLKLIAEFDRRNGWTDWATQSCAHWLHWKYGIDADICPSAIGQGIQAAT
jgi:hypothetical protein